MQLFFYISLIIAFFDFLFKCYGIIWDKLIYSDNGKGYNPNIKKSSLGLTLIETLAKKQLKAEMNISTNEGVKVKLRWKE